MKSYFAVKVDQRAQMLLALNKIYHAFTSNNLDPQVNIKEIVSDVYDESLKQKVFSDSKTTSALNKLKTSQANLIDKLFIKQIKDFYSILNSADDKKVFINSVAALKKEYTKTIEQYLSVDIGKKLKELTKLDEVQDSINNIIKPIKYGQEIFKYILNNKKITINELQDKLSHLDENQLDLIDQVCIKFYIKIELLYVNLEKESHEETKCYRDLTFKKNHIDTLKNTHNLDRYNEIKRYVIEKQAPVETRLFKLLSEAQDKFKEYEHVSGGRRSSIIQWYKIKLEDINIQLRIEKLNNTYNEKNFDDLDYAVRILKVVYICYKDIMCEEDGPAHNFVLFKTKGSTFAKLLETELVDWLSSDIELVYNLKINYFEEIDTLKELKKHSKALYEIISCGYLSLQSKMYEKYIFSKAQETSIDVYLNIFLELSAESIRKLRDQVMYKKNRISIVAEYHHKLIKLNYEVLQAKKINKDIELQINFAKKLVIITTICFNQVFNCGILGQNSTFAANLRQKLKGFLAQDSFRDVPSILTNDDFKEYGWYDSGISERLQEYIKKCIINAAHPELKDTKLNIQDLDFVDKTEENNFSQLRI